MPPVLTPIPLDQKTLSDLVAAAVHLVMLPNGRHLVTVGIIRPAMALQ